MLHFIDFFKVNQKLILIVASIFILVSTFFFCLGYLVSRSIPQIKSQDESMVTTESCEQNQVKLDEELSRCIADSGLVVNQTQEPYSFSKVGISSSFLSSTTQMETTEFDYKKQVILSHSLDANTGKVIVWEWKPQNLVLQFPLPQNHEVSNYFPIFIGYENYGLRPTFVSDLAKEWNQKDSFTNEEGITFYFWYEFGPKSIFAVQLQTYWPYSPMGKPIFVQINVPLDNTFVENEQDQKVLTAKAQAIEIAKTLSFTSK